jgi:hypothetical protein
MAWIFEATRRPEPARPAGHAAAAVADPARDARPHPLARAMVRRALELAGEVALGRVSATEVSRKPSVTGVTSPGGGATSLGAGATSLHAGATSTATTTGATSTVTTGAPGAGPGGGGSALA